jgi:R.HinP1I restriction endonuclease
MSIKSIKFIKNKYLYIMGKGHDIAKSGFEVEELFAVTIQNLNSQFSKDFLKLINEDYEKILEIKANRIHGQKTDVKIVIKYKDNTSKDVKFSIKKWMANFNQLERGDPDNYKLKWGLSDNILKLIKYFTGKLPSSEYDKNFNGKRMFVYQFKEEDKKEFLSFFKENAIKIITKVFKGQNPEMEPDYLLAVKTNSLYVAELCIENIQIKNIDDAIKFYLGNGEVGITPRGSFYIGKIKFQRKGGDNGKPSAQDLQVKYKPKEMIS